MRAIRVVTPLLFFVGVLGAAVAAQATSYSITGGSLTVTAADDAGQVCCSGNGATVSGIQVTFDSGSLASNPLSSFQIVTNPVTAALGGDMAGKSVTLTSLTIQPFAGPPTYTSTGTTTADPSIFDFNAAEIMVSGSATLSWIPGPAGTRNFSYVNTNPLAGFIQTTLGGQFGLNGITILSLTGLPNVPGGNLTVVGNLLATGVTAVPEPSTVVMLGGAFLGLAAARRRRL